MRPHRLAFCLIPLFALLARADIMTLTITPVVCTNMSAPVSLTGPGIGSVSLSLVCEDQNHIPPGSIPVSASASSDGVHANTSVDTGGQSYGLHLASADAWLDTYLSILAPADAAMYRTTISWIATGSSYGPSGGVGVELSVDGAQVLSQGFPHAPMQWPGSVTSDWAAVTGPVVGREVAMHSFIIRGGGIDFDFAHLDVTLQAEFSSLPEPAGVVLLLTSVGIVAICAVRRRRGQV